MPDAPAARTSLALTIAAASALWLTAAAPARADYDSPRHFTQTQAETIRKALADRPLARPQILEVIRLECTDCADFAQELVDIVEGVPGWEIHTTTVIGYSPEPTAPVGLTLVDGVPEYPMPATQLLKDALTEAEVPVALLQANKAQEGGAEEAPRTKIVVSRVKRF
jgi:hypothetical protein